MRCGKLKNFESTFKTQQCCTDIHSSFLSSRREIVIKYLNSDHDT